MKNINMILKRKSKGEINYFLAVMIGAAILVIIGWPEVKKIVESIFQTISAWWSTNLGKIFTNLQ